MACINGKLKLCMPVEMINRKNQKWRGLAQLGLLISDQQEKVRERCKKSGATDTKRKVERERARAEKHKAETCKAKSGRNTASVTVWLWQPYLNQ